MATCQRSLLSRPRIFSAPIPARAAFSTITTTVRPYKQARLGERGQRTTILTRFSSHRLGCAVVDIRKASTSSASPSQQTPPENILTWDRFFDLRRRRRWINLGSSVVTAATAVGVVTPILAQQDIDSWGAQISGLDPIIVLGISTFAVAAGGWLCGPSFGTAVFSLWAGRRGWNRLITEKEKSFFARIKRYRADPSASSPQNPIPDYYGEKIASVKDYRRWLKDQRAFNLKKSKNML